MDCQLRLISEGNLGLMQAVKKFDPDKGFRLATMLCGGLKLHSRTCIEILSLVKMGTTTAQKTFLI